MAAEVQECTNAPIPPCKKTDACMHAKERKKKKKKVCAMWNIDRSLTSTCTRGWNIDTHVCTPRVILLRRGLNAITDKSSSFEDYLCDLQFSCQPQDSTGHRVQRNLMLYSCFLLLFRGFQKSELMAEWGSSLALCDITMDDDQSREF